MRIVLFDIDGTLLTAAGAGRRSIQAALMEFFGTTGPADYWFDGKTDRQIVRDLMRAAGHDDAVIDARMPALLARYLERLHEELRDTTHTPSVYPGVPVLLDVLAQRDDVILGLLTGNLVDGAHAKLRAVGLVPARFAIGAFGSDDEHRPALARVAQARATRHLGRAVAGESLVVVGDTPADIACGQSVGARTVGVATGRYSVDELRQHGAHAVLADFSDTANAVSSILGLAA